MLLHVTSLPEPGGIGTMGQAARDFIDFLQRAGMKIWQMLPIGPTGFGESPYQSASACAGNPLLIDLETLRREGILDRWEKLPDAARADFDAVRAAKNRDLRRAFVARDWSGAINAFCDAHAWARDYALFMALKEHFDGASWLEWPEMVRMRDAETLNALRGELQTEIDFHLFVQVIFYRQWHALRAYAHERGIALMGDMPIYAAEDSADVWAHPEVFSLDRDRRPVLVSGVPPDLFCEDGQLWGNPTYNWKALRRMRYGWWMDRMRAMDELFDMLRLDHFIGFANYYAIKAGSPNARVGRWIKAPGARLFRRIGKEIPSITLIAEDLGVVNNRVRRLLRRTGFPGMKVLSFGFDGGADNPHRPEHIIKNCVVYTGTHDNDTALGFWDAATEEQRAGIEALLHPTDGQDFVRRLIEYAFASVADRVIIPMQDFLELDTTARMNFPGTVGGGNWRWRLTAMPDQQLEERIRTLVKRTQRV